MTGSGVRIPLAAPLNPFKSLEVLAISHSQPVSLTLTSPWFDNARLAFVQLRFESFSHLAQLRSKVSFLEAVWISADWDSAWAGAVIQALDVERAEHWPHECSLLIFQRKKLKHS